MNPFFINFGIKPNNFISRVEESEKIISVFKDSELNNNVFLITGVRGSGKTVCLSYINDYFSWQDGWVTVELVSNLDMLEQLASRLYDAGSGKFKFLNKSFSISFKGISFSIDGDKPITNIITLIEELLENLAKKNFRLLICVDEIIKNEYSKSFVQVFQLLLRKRFPIYLLMTGLFQNIYDLENEKSLTFLLRAPKISLEPLNLIAIANSYSNIFNISIKEAAELAKLTKGYAYCYQVLGYLLFESGEVKITQTILNRLDQMLGEFVYDKIWSELSNNDKIFMQSFNSDGDHDVSLLMNNAKMDKKNFSFYRDRLIKRGLLTSKGWGKLSLALPRFFDFIQMRKLLFGD